MPSVKVRSTQIMFSNAGPGLLPHSIHCGLRIPELNVSVSAQNSALSKAQMTLPIGKRLVGPCGVCGSRTVPSVQGVQ